MMFPQGPCQFRRLAQPMVAAILLSSCGGGGGGSTTPPPSATDPPPGTTRVTGSERLAWTQANASGMTFTIYVDGNPLRLESAGCDGAEPDAACSSPLPSLTDGVHTLAVAAVSPGGEEGPRSESISVQKVSARSVVSTAWLPDAQGDVTRARLETVVTAPDGQVFAVDVVARALEGPVQLSPTPDGRLVAAEAGGRVRIIQPGVPLGDEAALDARRLLDPPPIGPVGVSVDPEFARDRRVYLSFLARDESGTRLRIVRLREVGGTLGEPATIFEAPVRADTASTGGAEPSGGPMTAFGPDALLYVLLPKGLTFDAEPAASGPVASMLRIDRDGRAPAAGPVSGIAAHPVGFAWHPTNSSLWGIVPGGAGEARVAALGSAPSATARADALTLLMPEASSQTSAALVFPAAGSAGFPDPLVRSFTAQAEATVRLALPVEVDGVAGRIADVVASAGTWYAAIEDAPAPGTPQAGRTATIVRLSPRPR